MKTNTKDLTKGYKGYNSDFTCNPYAPYQYAENTIHELDKYKGLECCKTGFHYCINPLDILKFYPLIGVYGELNTFTKVEALGNIDTDVDEYFIKCATDKIKIGEKLSLDEYIDECIEYMSEYCKSKDGDEYSKISKSSTHSQISTSGDMTNIATSGEYSKVATSGDMTNIATSGEYSKVATSGDNSKMSVNGKSSKIVTSGENSQIATSGRYSQIAVSGDCSKVATSGECSHIATSGECSQVVASGKSSQVATSGYKSRVIISGECSRVATIGDVSNVNIQGINSIGINIGVGGIIKGVLGTWIALAEYDKDDKCINAKFGFIDGVILKADTWYKLKNGEFIEY